MRVSEGTAVGVVLSLCLLQQQAHKDRAAKTGATKTPFASSVDNYFQTDVISRMSINMAKAVKARATMRHE